MQHASIDAAQRNVERCGEPPLPFTSRSADSLVDAREAFQDFHSLHELPAEHQAGHSRRPVLHQHVHHFHRHLGADHDKRADIPSRDGYYVIIPALLDRAASRGDLNRPPCARRLQCGQRPNGQARDRFNLLTLWSSAGHRSRTMSVFSLHIHHRDCAINSTR